MRTQKLKSTQKAWVGRRDEKGNKDFNVNQSAPYSRGKYNLLWHFLGSRAAVQNSQSLFLIILFPVQLSTCTAAAFAELTLEPMSLKHVNSTK